MYTQYNTLCMKLHDKFFLLQTMYRVREIEVQMHKFTNLIAKLCTDF